MQNIKCRTRNALEQQKRRLLDSVSGTYQVLCSWRSRQLEEELKQSYLMGNTACICKGGTGEPYQISPIDVREGTILKKKKKKYKQQKS